MSIRRPDDDELDRLLAGAEWPGLKEPEATEAVERLKRRWRDMQCVEPHKPASSLRRWLAAASTAAAVAIVAGVLLVRSWPDRKQVARPESSDPSNSEPASAERVDGKPSALPGEPTKVAAAEPSEAGPSNTSLEQPVRQPNTYERVVLLARARAARATARAARQAGTPERASAQASESPQALPDERAPERLLANPSPRAAAQFLSLVADPAKRADALAALESAENPPIDDLGAFLDDPRQPVRLAAARALSTLDDARAVERLSQSVSGIGRQEALMALLASRSRRASELVAAARQNVYWTASVQAAEQQLLTLQTENGENLP